MPRTAVVAGVGPVLGDAVAREFAENGFTVGLLARSTDFTDDLETDLRDAGHDAVAVQADVTDADAVTDGFDRIRDALGPVEVLVHNASAGGRGGVEDCDPETFEAVWRTRAYGGFVCARAALADLRETAGTVVFSGTSYARGPAPGMVAWGSGAAATRGLARSLAADLGPDGVHVAYAAIAARIDTGDSASPGAVTAREVARQYRELVERDESGMTDLDVQPGA
jgi:NAD(P)-dependent dehydrogenase (short-subunit alcohol dehydrogenase family)